MPEIKIVWGCHKYTPKISGTPTYAQTVWPTETKFGAITHMEQ